MSEANETKENSNQGKKRHGGRCQHHGILQAAGAAIAGMTERPCLVFARSEIHRTDMELVYEAMGGETGPGIEVLLSSCGGNIEGAYSVSRSLRRRFGQVRVWVPYIAKSAATLMCLAADEIVMGPLGELGPMDVQSTLVSSAAVSSDASALRPFQALNSLDKNVRDRIREATESISRATGERPSCIVGHAIDMVSKVYAPIYGQLDPMRIGESWRGLRLGIEYGMRLLCRDRQIPGDKARAIVDRLVYGYPSHDFMIDMEEAHSIGLPVRPAQGHELPLLRDLGRALLVSSGMEPDMVELVRPGDPIELEVEAEARAEEDEVLADALAEEERKAEESCTGGEAAAPAAP
ncbi:MAG: SDH family Clp fold serine proteinase, partial [Alphaproteobacteria bacterium]